VIKPFINALKCSNLKTYRAQCLLWTLFIYLPIYETCILYNYMTASITQQLLYALQNLQSALSRAVLYIARPSVRLSPFVRPSVTRVDQSKTVREDYAIFTVQQTHTSSSCGISFIQKFWRIPLSGGVNQWWLKTSYFR